MFANELMTTRGFLAFFSRIPLSWYLVTVLVLPATTVLTGERLVLSEHTLRQVEGQYGTAARQRLLDWQNLLKDCEHLAAMEKLERINVFFNKMLFIDDAVHWKKEDYWATPIEFLASGGGDCEDFAIAKFFSLVSLGMKEDTLTLTYATLKQRKQAHMVLTYYPEPNAVPVILDNLVNTIDPASKRTDLLPVYSINATGLCLAKQRGKGQLARGPNQLSRWQDLLERMAEEFTQPGETP